VVRWPRVTLAVALALVLACAFLAYFRLGMSSDQNKLFSPRAKFFADYLEFNRKFPENEAVYIVIQPRQSGLPATRWIEAAETVSRVVRELGPGVVKSVDARVPAEALGEWGLAFDSPEAVRAAREQVGPFLQLVRLWGEKPGLGQALLGSTPTARFLQGLQLAPAEQRGDDTAAFTRLLAQSWIDSLQADKPVVPELSALDEQAATDPSRRGYYFVPDEKDKSRRLLLVRVYPNFQRTSLTAVSNTIDRIRETVASVDREVKDFDLGVTGRPVLEADEMRTTDQDSTLSEILALSAVFIGLVVMLRSVWLAIAAEITLGVGIGWTFGWATLTLGELNLLSIVFLIALIGIGMDYIVQVIWRYRALINEGWGDRPRELWRDVFEHVGPPINTACAGAAGAFLVSLASDFRGAADLGVIAGAGLLLCLLSAYTVLPAMLTLLPAKARPGRTQVQREAAWAGAGRAWWIGPTVWLVALAAGIPGMLRAGFNPNLIELQAQGLESVQLVRHLQTWSAVVMSNDLDVLREARKRLDGAPTVASTESLLQTQDNIAYLNSHPIESIRWAPPTPVQVDDLDGIARRADGLAALWSKRASPASTQAAASLRRFAGMLRAVPEDRSAALLSRWQAAFVSQLRDTLAQFSPGPLDWHKLPTELRSHFVSDDGTYALYIYPREDLWDRTRLREFIDDIEPRLTSLPNATLTGIAMDIHHSTASIQASFYRSAGLALGLIVLLVLLDLRSVTRTLMAISVLALGLPMLVAVMGLFGQTWNFANFFGLPILIGAGHEYGVFMIHRYLEARKGRTWGRWDVADKALLMCAYVTTVAFGFFWLLASHQGLKSLGFVMTAGTVCIYLATVAVVRPVLKWRLRRDAPDLA
jgi:predicted RND superfamily exporter protein